FWQHRGYTRHPELRTTFSWQEIGETAESPKPMVFWLKNA
ncbi:MAG: GNAT family N-acetyltransferase, partial [Gammaproteobacteria bacterium]|nr:GNAT family N-acetyltransferase [Gammaproteobacteria bacterium]